MKKLLSKTFARMKRQFGVVPAITLFNNNNLRKVWRESDGSMTWTIDQYTNMLCSLCRDLNPVFLNADKKLLAWWEEHQKLDAQREREEVAERQRQSQLMDARRKAASVGLTNDDIRLLHANLSSAR
ncbi:MAG: hypothetical protein EBQ80_05870 [Proteobacteria bacterium]|nr:hypothetical protein [Pseudomonadota bacterium]